MNIQHKIRRFGLLVSILLTSILFAGNASAFVIVDQQPISTGDGLLSNIDDNKVGDLSADNFTVNDNSRLDTLTWWGAYDGGVPAADLFTVELFADDTTGNPGMSPIFEFNSSNVTRNTVMDTDYYMYSLDVSLDNVVLNSGDQYFLSIMNNTDFDWYWLLSDETSENWFRTTYDEAWVPGSEIGFMGDMAMKIEGTTVVAVPEPETLSLFLLPLIYLVGTKLKSKYAA